jgi:hypothetical protein
VQLQGPCHAAGRAFGIARQPRQQRLQRSPPTALYSAPCGSSHLWDSRAMGGRYAGVGSCISCSALLPPRTICVTYWLKCRCAHTQPQARAAQGASCCLIHRLPYSSNGWRCSMCGIYNCRAASSSMLVQLQPTPAATLAKQVLERRLEPYWQFASNTQRPGQPMDLHLAPT